MYHHGWKIREKITCSAGFAAVADRALTRSGHRRRRLCRRNGRSFVMLAVTRVMQEPTGRILISGFLKIPIFRKKATMNRHWTHPRTAESNVTGEPNSA